MFPSGIHGGPLFLCTTSVSESVLFAAGFCDSKRGCDGSERFSARFLKIFRYPDSIPNAAEEMFRANLALVERVISGVCRRAGLHGADAEDFASTVNLALIENDYAILRGYEGRAPLGAFLTVVVQRMLSREWMRLRGRWHPSAEAERSGAAAVLLEKLMVRDGRSLDEAVAIVRNVDPSLDGKRARSLAEALPLRF